MNIENLATLLLNFRIGKPDRGYDVVPGLVEQLDARLHPEERENFSHAIQAFLNDIYLKGERQDQLRVELFTLASRAIS